MSTSLPYADAAPTAATAPTPGVTGMTCGSAAWLARLRDRCNADPGFQTATAFADTKLVLVFGDQRHYWKIYKGSIIDSVPFVPSFDPLGYDVCIRASMAVWESIAERRSKVWDHFNGFELEIGGNHLEAHRLHEAFMIICQDLVPAVTEEGLPR